MSASLRTRRPSTVLYDGDEAPPQHQEYEIPAVPSMPPDHRPPGASRNRSGDQRPAASSHNSGSNTRPPARHAKSSDSDTRAGASGSRHRAGTSASRDGGGAGGEPSKVGAILLNKRQSVSFGKAMASQTRAGVRGDEGYGSGGSGARYNDAIGRAAAPPMPKLAQGGGRRGAAQEGTGMSAGEEMIATGPRGPTGAAFNDLLKEDFVAETCQKAFDTCCHVC